MSDPIISPEHHQHSSITRKLYTSHFLSTWNMRLFEFGAVLFLANIYPNTLLPMSIYALVRALAAVLLSPFLGQYIDRSDRLISIRLSIIGQRCAVIASCAIFYLMLAYPSVLLRTWTTALSLTFLSLLACVEKLCATANTVAVERDWVVVIGDDDETFLQKMNAQMRRIDLFCKLVGPLAIALVDGISPQVAVLTTLGLNVASITVEYGLIARVYGSVPALQVHDGTIATDDVGREDNGSDEESPPEEPTPLPAQPDSHGLNTTLLKNLKSYSTSPAVLPSLSLSLLYLTVLSFSGQMTTYLLTYPPITPAVIGLIRTLATTIELGSTWLAPYLISRIGVTRAGIWCLSWQIACLAVGVSTFFYPSTSAEGFSISLLIASVTLSRLGLYAFDLTAQQTIQLTISPSSRATFSATEASIQNLFELLSFLTTIVFPKPTQFKIPACVSFGAVCAAGALYALYVRRRRGHLLHLPCDDWGRDKGRVGGEHGGDDEARGVGGASYGYEIVRDVDVMLTTTMTTTTTTTTTTLDGHDGRTRREGESGRIDTY